MSTAGEAASLFGASDPSGDLFGDAVGSNVETSTHSVGPDPFSGQETTSFFDEVNSSSDTSTFTSNHAQSEAPSGSYGQSWVNTNGNQHEGYAQVVDGYSTHYSRQPYANGWNEQQAQWSVYEQQQQQQEATIHSTTNTSQPILQHSYDPYAPPPSQSVASISTGYYAPPAPKQRAVTAPPYNPYAPTTSAYAHQLTSQSQGVPPQAIYGPYTPAHPTVLQEPVHQRELSVDRTQVHIKKSSVGSSISSIAASVPPPLPSASAYRPKVTNAYDPPLPPPKPARRSHATPPVVQYPAQSPFALPSSSPVPTPPPPRGRSAAGHYDSSPLPRRPSVYPPAPLPSSQGLHTHDSQLAPPPQEHFVDHHVPQPSYGHLPPNGYAGERWPVPPQASATNDASDPAQYFSPPLNHSEPYNIGSSGPEHPEPKENLSISDHDELISPSPLEHHIPQASSHPLPSSTYQAPVGSIEDTVAEIGIPEECDVIQRDAFASTEETLGLPANPPSGTTIDDIEGLPSVSSLPGLQHYAFQQAPHDPYKPLAGSPPSSPPYHRPPERARTPGSSSGRSWTSPTKSSVVPPARKSSGFSPPPPAPRDRSGSGRFIAPSSPYNPEILHRTVSPSALSIHSVHAQDVIHDSLPSSEIVEGFPPSRNRSMSSSSTLSISASTRDPYAPLQRSSLSSVYEPSTSSQTLADISSTLSTTHQGSEFQLPALMTLPQQAPYAPSPSLLGTNDPLGRTSVRVPIVTFGFGGKIVTCFHGLSTLSTGFDVALSSRQSTDVQIRILHQVIPESVVETSVAQFPGPLFCDPSNTTSIVRAGTTTQTKTKKGLVVKYLEERSSEISRGMGYLHQDSLEGHRAEAKRVLILLLKVMVENDGRLSGSPEIDSAVRSALVPSLPSSDPSTERLKTADSLGFSRSGDLADVSASSYSGLGAPTDPKDATVTVHTLRVSHLEKIQNLLVRGDRRTAFQYAADEKLWAHAMVIASSIDKESWKEVVSEFIHTELANPGVTTALPVRGTLKPTMAGGYEGLKVAYSLYAGHGAASIQELLPPKLLVNGVSPLQPPSSSHTPMTPAFPQQPQPQSIPLDALSKWADTAAMVVSSPMTSDTSSALSALGDQLVANGWYEAAHACYLLSPKTSPMGGIGAPAARVLLFGGSNPTKSPGAWKDPDPIIFTEIVEFALSLATPAKGQDPFLGLPHLQAYKLIRAASLAEMGHDQLATRYCEAISNSTGRPSPYVHQTLTEEIKNLHDRLIAAPHDKSGSWIGSKITRPSLDKLGGWLGGQLSNFVAGEADSPQSEDARGKERNFTGPFAHYSTISSTTSSTMPSPKISTTDLTEVAPPYRAGSALALRPPTQVQINRASSAMDYIRRKPSPVQRVSSANAISSPYSDPYSPQLVPNGFVNFVESSPKPPPSSATNGLTVPQPQEPDSVDTPLQGPRMGSWWGAPDSEAPTPTAATFIHTDTSAPSANGFVSLMDDPALSITPIATSKPPHAFGTTSSMSPHNELDDDELGLGNGAKRRSNSIQNGDIGGSNSTPIPEAKSNAESEKPVVESKSTPSSGWLSRWWKRSDSTPPPGPVKANLGDETSFYYDKDLKRWVNKSAHVEAAAPKPPPPPPRAQTASPGSASARLHGGPSPGLTPPIRPATAIDLSNSPPKKPPMRPRSNLVPSDAAAPPTPPTAVSRLPSSMDGPPGLDGPPSAAARAKAQAKRNVRSRYVDVFQQS